MRGERGTRPLARRLMQERPRGADRDTRGANRVPCHDLRPWCVLRVEEPRGALPRPDVQPIVPHVFALPRRPNSLAPLAVLVPGLLLGACSDSALSVVCPGAMRPSVLVNVVDSVSRQDVAAQASGSWTMGAMTDSLRHVPPSVTGGPVRLGAFGPAGTYEVRITRPGSPVWVQRNIQVGEGSCGPFTVEFEARLAPAP